MSVYFDHASTTPMTSRVRHAFLESLERVGNASSLHTTGRRARRAVEEAREKIAEALGARPSEVLFTSGGTESNNLAVKGGYWMRTQGAPHCSGVIASNVEHHAVLDPVEWLAQHEGARVQWAEVDREGLLHPEALRETFSRWKNPSENVALASVMWANNEVGTVQPIRELSQVAEEYGVPLHTDAVQAVSTQPVHFADSGACLLSVSAHKLGGPIGVGVLLVKRGVQLTPLTHGGGQERSLRSGTLNTPGVVAAAEAVAAAVEGREEYAQRMRSLRDALREGVQKMLPDAIINGAADSDALPTVLSVSIPGCDGDALLMLLDAAGVECSTGSACTAGVPQPSHVLLAMGVDPQLANSSLRFSFGHTSTQGDVDRVLEVLPGVVERARAVG